MDSLHDRLISGDELLSLLRERLAEGQTIRYLPFRGVSMLPMLRQGKDAVELSTLPQRLKKYDLPVYQYPSGKVVMHRVIAVREDHYVCMGDNTYEKEYIRHEQMIAVVTAFTRGGRVIPVTDPGYRLYCRVWVATAPLRKFIRRVKNRLKRMLRAK